MSEPVVKLVSVHDELKRARDAFYNAMFEDNEEERDRNFFGDEDYGTLKTDFMSMTMQQRDA